MVLDIRDISKFEDTLPKLVKFLNDHPEVNLEDYIDFFSESFQGFIKKEVQRRTLLGAIQDEIPK